MSPYDSDDLTKIIVPEGDKFLLLRSSDNAENTPEYQELGRFLTAEAALAHLASNGESSARTISQS
jgi:hypothetical protein